jgi:hypothetical protein
VDVWNQIIGGGFVVGSIFWAGATYSRIGRIEKDLGDLIKKLGALAELDKLKSQIETHSKEIVMLRKSVYGETWRHHGGPEVLNGDED